MRARLESCSCLSIMTINVGRSASALCVALTAPVLCGLALVHCSSSTGGGETGGGQPPLDSGSRLDANTAADGRVQDAGVEAAPRIPCDAANACSAPLTCCSDFCVDTSRDPQNCGACGTACGGTQFCTGVACEDAVFKNVCANGAATVLTDPYPVDIEAGVQLAMALPSCTDGGVDVAVVPQTQQGVLVPVGDAGRPNTGVGNTLVAGGSWWGQMSVAYMDNTGLTPVYLTNDGTTAHIYQRSSGVALVTADESTLTAQHDFFILEVAVEPISGTLCLFGEGILSAGTAAAGYYGANVIVPGRSAYSSSFYVYEWTDTNNNMVPDQADTFTLIGQGS